MGWFLGYPIFEGLVSWDLTRAEGLATLRSGLAERWEQAADDKKTWIFHLRRGVKFHDGTDFNAAAVICNLDRYFKNDSAQFEIAAAAMTRARIGSPPDLANLPPGCAFAPRCSQAIEACRKAVPDAVVVEPGHFACCLRAQPAAAFTAAHAEKTVLPHGALS